MMTKAIRWGRYPPQASLRALDSCLTILPGITFTSAVLPGKVQLQNCFQQPALLFLLRAWLNWIVSNLCASALSSDKLSSFICSRFSNVRQQQWTDPPTEFRPLSLSVYNPQLFLTSPHQKTGTQTSPLFQYFYHLDLLGGCDWSICLHLLCVAAGKPLRQENVPPRKKNVMHLGEKKSTWRGQVYLVFLMNHNLKWV